MIDASFVPKAGDAFIFYSRDGNLVEEIDLVLAVRPQAVGGCALDIIAFSRKHPVQRDTLYLDYYLHNERCFSLECEW